MFVGDFFRIQSSSTPEVRSSAFVPMVYEQVKREPVRWEYHVLTIDLREEAAVGAERLNALGTEGWILAGVLDERKGENGQRIHYYFMRQAREVHEEDNASEKNA